MNKTIPKNKLREFGILIGLLFPFLIGFLIPFLIGHSFRSWTVLISAPCLILGLFRPQSLANVYKFWVKIGDVLGWFNSHIILGLVYIVILLPIALIMKMFGYDPLKKKFHNKKSYFEYSKLKEIDLTRIF